MLNTIKISNLKNFFRLFVLSMSFIFVSKVQAEVIINGQCRQGECIQLKYLSKTILKQTNNYQLYSIKTQNRILSWEDREKKQNPSFDNPELSYVFCSRKAPAYIFKTEENNYRANLLNPGGDWFGYNYESIQLYWITCHNIVGPDFFSDEMTARAISIGYPLNLESEQITLQHPLEILSLTSF